MSGVPCVPRFRRSGQHRIIASFYGDDGGHTTQSDGPTDRGHTTRINTEEPPRVEQYRYTPEIPFYGATVVTEGAKWINCPPLTVGRLVCLLSSLRLQPVYSRDRDNFMELVTRDIRHMALN